MDTCTFYIHLGLPCIWTLKSSGQTLVSTIVSPWPIYISPGKHHGRKWKCLANGDGAASCVIVTNPTNPQIQPTQHRSVRLNITYYDAIAKLLCPVVR